MINVVWNAVSVGGCGCGPGGWRGWEKGGIQELSALSIHFCCGPKTALKNSLLILKEVP